MIVLVVVNWLEWEEDALAPSKNDGHVLTYYEVDKSSLSDDDSLDE